MFMVNGNNVWPCHFSMPESAKSEDSKNVVWAQLLSSRESG